MIFVGAFLALAVVSTASVCIAVTRSKISDKLFRFAIFPSAIATHIGIINHGKLIFQNTLRALQDQTRNLIAFQVSNPQKVQALLQQRIVTNQNDMQDDHTVLIRVNSEKEVSEVTKSK